MFTRISRSGAAGALLALLFLSLAYGPALVAAQGAAGHVDVVTIDSEIDIWTAGYMDRGVSLAESDGAAALVIILRTPGGVVQPTLDIMERLLNASVPVIAYIPPGAHSASGGAYVAIAANVIGMAPGTAIGACHPVGDSGQNLDTDIRDKETNLLASKMRTYAQQRGHNPDWAENCVRNSVTLTEQEALAQKVAEYIAPNLTDLLSQAEGRAVTVATGPATLHTRGAEIRYIEPNFVEQFFHFLLNPNIALILLAAGQLAIIVELYNPGATVPAVVGVICLVLAAVVLFNLPTNWAAVILIIASIVMFVLDIKVTGVVLTAGGIVAFVLGALLLFRPFTPPALPVPAAPDTNVSPWVIGGVVSVMALFFVFVLRAAYTNRRTPVIMGPQTMVGATGIVITDLNPMGTVHAHSEEWTAEALTPPIARGERVQVVEIDGLTLKVKKA